MLMQRDTPAAVVDHVLRSGWFTLRELGELVPCSESWACVLVKRTSRTAVIFRRPRQTFGKHWEYRIFPKAINVQPQQTAGGIQVWIEARS